MGVGGCGWPSSAYVSRMVRPYLTFANSAPKSASAAGDAKSFRMVQRVKISPFSVMGSPSLGTKPRKKWPEARIFHSWLKGRTSLNGCLISCTIHEI